MVNFCGSSSLLFKRGANFRPDKNFPSEFLLTRAVLWLSPSLHGQTPRFSSVDGAIIGLPLFL
jgi:hypothetical protein